MTRKGKHIDKIKLDKIEKKSIYAVKESYFETLPSKVQERVIDLERRKQPAFIMTRALKVALPVIALIIMSVYFGLKLEQSPVDVQAMIDEVATEELISYLNDSELSTEEILSLININELDIDGMYEEEIDFIKEDEIDEFLDMYPDYESEVL